MPDPAEYLDVVGDVTDALRALDLEPILVGGMALVVLGSRRVTRDFDLLIPAPGERLAELVGLMYDRNLQLVSRLNKDGEVTATVSGRGAAAARLRIDRPPTAYFYDSRTGLRIDLLFDFPIAAATLAPHATRVRIGTHVVHVAAERDLLELKRIAAANRKSPGDMEDLAFLERRIQGS
jgi:hypothetical protein